MLPVSPGGHSLDLEALLAHAGFVRGLARALLWDEAVAEDVAQETLLAALQRPPAGTSLRAGGLRSWLGGVVRNLARQTRRTEERRVRREQSFGLPEPAPPASDAAARLELIERLVAAVRGLDEPYRTVVLRRFFEGATPQAIAAEQGLPLETVRTRLKRAIERLRQVLDARGRESWSALLLPLAGLPPAVIAGVAGTAVVAGSTTGLVVPGMVAAGSATGLSSSLIGAVAVSTKGKLLVAATFAAAAATTAFLWPRADPPIPQPSGNQSAKAPLPAPISVPPEAAPAPTLTPQRAAESPDKPAEDPLATFFVRGRLLLGNSRDPFPHGHVRARLWPGYDASGAAALDAMLESDDQGAFTWPIRPPQGTVWIKIRGEEPDCRSGTAERLVLAGTPAPGDFAIAIHPLDCTIEGRVVDLEERPMPDARVGLWGEESVECDEEGNYAIAAPSSYESIYVVAWAPGCAEDRAEVALGLALRNGSARQDFRLKGGARLVGRVTDASGAPIEGAIITAFRLYFAKAKSGADGSYRLDHLSLDDGQQNVYARADGFVETAKQLPLVLGDNAQDFVLQRGVRVSGVALLPDGSPARGAELFIGFARFAYNRLDARAHDAGEFTFPCVPRGVHKLFAESPGVAPFHMNLEVPADRTSLDGVTVRLGVAHFLEGVIVDADGNPRKDAFLLLESVTGDAEVYGRTDGAGRFRVDGLPEGPLNARLTCDGYMLQELKGLAVDQKDLRFVLRRAGRAAGRVVDGTTGSPLTNFRITFVRGKLKEGEQFAGYYSASWAEPGKTFNVPDGRWDTGEEQMQPGAVLGIQATAEGYAPAIAERVVLTEDPDPDALVLRLFAGGSVDGVVVDAHDGRPVAGAVVKFANDAMPIAFYGGSAESLRPIARSDVSGRFHFDRLPAGSSKVYVEHTDYPGTFSAPFVVPSSGSAPSQEVRLAAGGAIDGTLLDLDGRPQPNVEITLYPATEQDVRQLHQATTDAAGRFHCDRLPSGRWQVSSQGRQGNQGTNLLTTFVEVKDGETATCELKPPGHAILTGRISSDGVFPTDLTLSAWQVVKDEATGQSVRLILGGFASNGSYELAGLSAGTWTVDANAWNMSTRTSWSGRGEVTLADGEHATLDLEVTARQQGN